MYFLLWIIEQNSYFREMAENNIQNCIFFHLFFVLVVLKEVSSLVESNRPPT